MAVPVDNSELQSRSVSTLREELVVSSEEEHVAESADGGGSMVSITDEPGEAQQPNLKSTSEEQLATNEDSRPSSTTSTPRSPLRGKLIPPPLDIVSGGNALHPNRNISPLAREAMKASGGAKAGATSPGIPGHHTPPTVSRTSSAESPPTVSRTSSTESPQSPFFIPRNPFLMHVDKMPKFQWSMAHFSLLESLMKSLQEIVNKWKLYVQFLSPL